MAVKFEPDVQTLIDKAGGVVRLASILSVARTTVISWREQGFIPGNRVVQISAALKIPSEQVLKLVQAPKARKRRSKSHISTHDTNAPASSAKAA